jgi:hypothetical protein
MDYYTFKIMKLLSTVHPHPQTLAWKPAKVFVASEYLGRATVLMKPENILSDLIVCFWSTKVKILAVEGCIGRQAEESDVIVYSPCAIVLGVNDFRRRGHDDTVGL